MIAPSALEDILLLSDADLLFDFLPSKLHKTKVEHGPSTFNKCYTSSTYAGLVQEEMFMASSQQVYVQRIMKLHPFPYMTKAVPLKNATTGHDKLLTGILSSHSGLAFSVPTAVLMIISDFRLCGRS